MLENLKWFLIVFNCCGGEPGEEVAVLPAHHRQLLGVVIISIHVQPKPNKWNIVMPIWVVCSPQHTSSTTSRARYSLSQWGLATDVISQEVGYNLGFQPGLAEINKKNDLFSYWATQTESSFVVTWKLIASQYHAIPIKKYSHLVLRLLIGAFRKISRNKYLSDR